MQVQAFLDFSGQRRDVACGNCSVKSDGMVSMLGLPKIRFLMHNGLKAKADIVPLRKSYA